MPTQIQLRRGTAAQWTSANPTLASGELGVETDTGKIKVGSGSTAWTGLPYSSAGIGGSTTQVQYNNAGAFGGISNATTDGTTLSMTSPKVITGINDTNGNELLKVTATASAVNELTLANAATGGNPVLSATGGDTNIGITLTPKGTGGVVFPAGAVGTPAITTTGDTNTGVYFPAADTAAITTGGSERLRITSSGALLAGLTSSVGTNPLRVQVKGGAGGTAPYAGYAIISGNDEVAGYISIVSSGENSIGIYVDPENLRASSSLQFNVDGTERMRIDSNGRVGINTTSQTTNLARLQVNHDPSTDRYGVYVPGGQYVSSGPSGNQFGGYFVPHVSNSTSGFQCGVYGSANPNGVGSAFYGGYFDGQSSATPPNYGVYAVARQSDLNGPATATGGWFNVNTTSSSAGSLGGTISVRAENTATLGSSAIGVSSSTVAGASNIYGYYYTHAGSLQFRVKSNGGIDNYSSNNTNLSDRREKTDFASAKSYLDTICAIPVQTFKYINQEDDLPTLGVVAQDVQAVAPELVNESDWGTQEEPKMRLSVYETDLMYALMKSIQELKAIVDAQAARIAVFEGN